MCTEKTSELISILEGNDLWVRGKVYVRFKHALEDAEIELKVLGQRVARARYEHEIARRIHAKTTAKPACKDWERRVEVAHKMLLAKERRLAEVAERADYCRAMLAEIEADLGEKAGQYEKILDALERVEEDYWGEFEDRGEFDEFWDWDEFDEWDEEGEWEDEDKEFNDNDGRPGGETPE